jgi:hypothetical protein
MRCVPPDSPAVAGTVARGSLSENFSDKTKRGTPCGQDFSCGTGNGCCRYHVAQLTCDEENVSFTCASLPIVAVVVFVRTLDDLPLYCFCYF